MEKLKSTLFLIIILALISLGGFWAIATLESGSEHVNKEKIETLKEENKELKKKAEDLQEELDTLQVEVQTEAEIGKQQLEEKLASVTTYKYQELINELEQLIDDSVVIKLKSRGTRVGTLQKFFNIYNNTSNKVDNDFGTTTQKTLIAFQKDQGLSASGEAGTATFTKMIEWLKKQG